MKKINLPIVIVLVLAYLFNSNVIEWIYPEAVSDYDEFLKYYDLRNQVYSVMFFLMFTYVFFTSEKITRALAAFGVFVSFASVVDKVFYNFYQFKDTDYVIIIAGIIAAIYSYYRGNGVN